MIANELKLMGLPASFDKLAHAYVVEGSDQINVFEQSELLAQLLLCSEVQQQNTTSVKPCGQCHSCKLFGAKNHPDYMLVQVEKTSIGVDDIRQLSNFLIKTSQLSGNQVVVVEQAHLMTESASNALLKTLEEPTNNSYLLLLTDSKNTLLPTILSRCQFVTLGALSKTELQQQYPDLPDYLLGFGGKSESNLNRWIETSKIEEFNDVYQFFISWLKHQASSSVLVDKLVNDKELHDFFIYLVNRRIRQLLIKATHLQTVNEAHQIVITYINTQKNITGINKALSLTALIEKLTNKI